MGKFTAVGEDINYTLAYISVEVSPAGVIAALVQRAQLCRTSLFVRVCVCLSVWVWMRVRACVRACRRLPSKLEVISGLDIAQADLGDWILVISFLVCYIHCPFLLAFVAWLASGSVNGGACTDMFE